MELIDQSSKIWGECPTDAEESILWIEKAGRSCYRSEDKIVQGSGRKFVDNIIRRGHPSVIEHSNLVLRTKGAFENILKELIECRGTMNSPYISSLIMNDRIYLGGNYRAWMELAHVDSIQELFNNVPDFLEVVYDISEIPKPLRRYTVEFTTDRAVTHELVRHRPCSFSQESQRYVSYGEIKFIKPSWFHTEIGKPYTSTELLFKTAMKEAEENYNFLRKAGLSPQDARVVLPNQCSTKIVITADSAEWDLIFDLRCSKAAYAQIRNLLTPVRGFMAHNV